MTTLNLKVVASAFAALALTMLMSWTFVDATSVARIQRDGAAASWRRQRAGTLGHRSTLMDPQWDDSQPIYRQLRDRVVAMILEGVLKEGDPLPSVRAVAAEFRLNPLTVLKGYQQLVDEQLVEKKRGRGMFVNDGARQALMKDERSTSSKPSGRRSTRPSRVWASRPKNS